MSIGDYLKENNIIALDGIDTRALTRHLREKGTMKGILTTEDTPEQTLLKKVREAPDISESVLVPEVTVKEPYTWDNGGRHIVIIDLGLKLSIARSFHNAGVPRYRSPCIFSAGNIMDLHPAGLLFPMDREIPRISPQLFKQ